LLDRIVGLYVVHIYLITGCSNPAIGAVQQMRCTPTDEADVRI